MSEKINNEILTLKSKSNLNCILCEKCCEYRGDIKITPINVLEISKFLNISIDEFLEKYTEEVKGEEPEIVIKGIGEKRECIFNDRKTYKCMINSVKPMQCVVFPLVPFDVRNDLFINTNACPVPSNKMIKVDKWVNGNHKIYSKNKEVYIRWVKLMEEIGPIWKSFSKEKQDNIKKILFREYDTKKNYRKQVLENIDRVKKLL